MLKILCETSTVNSGSWPDTSRFERMYPDLIKRGFICMIVIPLIFLVLMLVVDARMLFLVLWILSLIFLSVYRRHVSNTYTTGCRNSLK